MKSLIRLSLTAFAIVTLVPAGIRAQDTPSASPSPSASASATQARALVELMTSRGVQAIAAKDPQNAGRYVAALYVPGAELLVVSADYPAPAILDKRLKDGQYQEVYVDLQSTGSTTHKLFIEDLQANGLQAASAPNEPFDTVTDNGSDLRFNGDWAAQHLTQDQYAARFTTMDARYADMLSALLARLRTSDVKATER